MTNDYFCGNHLIRTRFDGKQYWFRTQDMAAYVEISTLEFAKGTLLKQRSEYCGIPQYITLLGCTNRLKSLQTRKADELLSWIDICLLAKDSRRDPREYRPQETSTGTALTLVQPGLRTFDFNGSDVRVLDRNGNPWFIARDVCEQLGLAADKRSYGHHLKHLHDDEVCPMSDLRQKIPGSGMHSARLISESGLYKLIMRSDKPTARAFQHWVTSVVLPAIRKDGGYILGEENLNKGGDLSLTEAELVLRAMEALQRKIGRLETERTVDKQRILTLEAELDVLSIAEYVSLKHVYWGRGTKAKVAMRAIKISNDNNLPVVKEDRTLKDGTVVQVNVYHRKVLDQAVEELDLAA